MEEEDELLPDEDGHLDLKYRGWTEIDTAIWSLTETLVTLDLSFNNITTIPDSIEILTHVKELNCSCNEITSLPSTLGSLRDLKILKANGNRLTSIPNKIGDCKYLTHLFLSENQLTDLPSTIADCFRLKVLKLQNNNLRQLPISIANMEKIETIDLSNNRDLNMVPEELREDTKAIMWILSVHLKNSKEMKLILSSTRELGRFAKIVEDKTANTKEKMALLAKQKSSLLLERSSIKYYLALEKTTIRCKKKIRHAVKECKELFNQKSAPAFVVTNDSE